MKLLNQEHVTAGLRSTLLDALREEGIKSCDPSIHDAPVSLEPPFRRFSPHQILNAEASSTTTPAPSNTEREYLHLTFGPRYQAGKDLSQSALVSLLSLQRPMSLEVIKQERTALQISCSPSDASVVRAAFGNSGQVRLEPTVDYLSLHSIYWRDYFPTPPYFRSLTSLSPASLLESFLATALQVEGAAFLQLLIRPARQPWQSNVLPCLELEKQLQGLPEVPGSQFSRLTDLQLKLTRNKAAAPFFCAAIRIGGDRQLLGTLAAALNAWQYGSQPLQFLEEKAYQEKLGESSSLITGRLVHRHGMLLSLDELLPLVQLPRPEFVKQARLFAAPSQAEGLLLGYSNHTPVCQSAESRIRHLVACGTTGKGKSTLLLNMILQDVEQGRGLAVIDPHGDLITSLLPEVPENRVDDVVLISPAAKELVLGFNPFEVPPEADHGKMADDLVFAVRNQFSSWGERMESIYRQSFYALFKLPGACLADMRQLLSRQDASLRNQLLPLLDNQEAVRFWTEDFHQYSSAVFDPILNKLSKFLLNEYLGRVFSQRENRLDLQQLIEGGKVLLIHLPTGVLSIDGTNLLGSLLMTSLYHAVLSRVNLPTDQRKPFYLYVDEFQRFSTKSTQDMLREARKFSLGLILAFQQYDQFKSEINLALSNVDSLVAFDLGVEDAQKLLKKFDCLNLQDLQHKGKGEAWAILDDQVYRLTTCLPQLKHQPEVADLIRRNSLSRYYTTEAKPLLHHNRNEPLYDEV